jgi:hypothetical protein
MLGRIWGFLRGRKRYWLLPFALALALLGLLTALSQPSAVSPFVYDIF